MLRSHSPTLLYSYLRATIGSTRIARRAGIYVASEAAASGASTPKKNAMPSSALMKKRREARTRQTPIARAYCGEFCVQRLASSVATAVHSRQQFRTRNRGGSRQIYDGRIYANSETATDDVCSYTDDSHHRKAT